MNRPADPPADIPVGSYLQDHHFLGRPVLPAVEALQFLARTALEQGFEIDPRHSFKADFFRFLYLPRQGSVPVKADFELAEEGGVRASLLTETTSKSGTMTRRKEHAAVVFGAGSGGPEIPPLDLVSVPEGPALGLSAERLYRELVPFGPAFHNARGTIWLAPGGAVGQVEAPEMESMAGPLGSPFPMDAGFHLACAWGQRFSGVVGFPVGYGERFVFEPARPGEIFFCRVFPRGEEAGVLRYDVWLFSEDGRPREAVLGLVMKDVSSVKLKAPDWLRFQEEPGFSGLAGQDIDLVVIEIEAQLPLGRLTFSEREKIRAGKLGEKRKKSFTAARLALKQLARVTGEVQAGAPAQGIDTLASDSIRPSLGRVSKNALYCSAAHDRRLAVAAAGRSPIGVDVEPWGDKAYRGRRLFMSDQEQKLADRSDLGPERAALQVWTIKEAAAKALGLDLAKAWGQVETVILDEKSSRVLVGGRQFEARHAEFEGHLMTLMIFP